MLSPYFFFKKLTTFFSHRPAESDYLFSCRPPVTPLMPNSPLPPSTSPHPANISSKNDFLLCLGGARTTYPYIDYARNFFRPGICTCTQCTAPPGYAYAGKGVNSQTKRKLKGQTILHTYCAVKLTMQFKGA